MASERSSGGPLRIGRSTKEEIGLSEQRKYRSWTAQQKLEIVLAGLRGDRTVIVGWELSLRCRADEAIAVVERAAVAYGIQPGELVLGSDNGSAFTARRFRARLADARDQASPRRLPRPREPGLHRELVRKTQRTRGLAQRIRNPSTTRNAGSAATSTATTTGRTHGSGTRPRTRSSRPGKVYKTSRPNLSTPAGSTSLSRRRSRDRVPSLPFRRNRALYCGASWWSSLVSRASAGDSLPRCWPQSRSAS